MAAKKFNDLTFGDLVPILEAKGPLACEVMDDNGGSLTFVPGDLTISKKEGDWVTLAHPGLRPGGYPVKGGHAVQIGSIVRGPKFKGDVVA